MWFTKIDVGELAGTNEHKTKLAASMRLSFAVGAGGAKPEDCGLYKRDPRKHPDAENLLPAEMAKAERRQIREMLGGRRRR